MLKKSKILLVALVCFITAMTFIGCGSPEEKFLRDYENYVVKYEKAMASNDATAVAKLAKDAAKLDERAAEIMKSDGWTKEYEDKYVNLSLRIAKAAFSIF